MPFWVTIRDSDAGEKTLVSHASTESAARKEAESKGLTVADITPISTDLDRMELVKYEHLSPSGIVAFQIFCLTAGQLASILSCIGCIPLAASAFIGGSGTTQAVEVSFMVFIAGVLLFCTFASMLIVFTYVKRQLRS